jgi:hypothetical protein
MTLARPLVRFALAATSSAQEPEGESTGFSESLNGYWA